MMILMLVLMCVAMGGGQAELAVWGPNQVEVSAGEEAILMCEVEHPYKFCNFVNPAGTILNLGLGVNYEKGRISFVGSEEEMKKSCGVKISPVVEADHGAWRCQVIAIVNGRPQVGRSQANITLSPPTLDISSRDTHGRLEASHNATGRLEASSNATGRLEASLNAGGRLEASLNAGGRLEASHNAGGRLEASHNTTGRIEPTPNATNTNPNENLAHGEDIIGDQMGEILSAKIVEIRNKTNGKRVNSTKSSEVGNEEEMFALSTEFIPEVEINYTEEHFSGTTDQRQDPEFNQATSPSPRVVDFNPSEKNPVSEYLKEVISTPVFEEEFGKSEDEQLNDLTDEHVLVVIIMTMILTAIFITFIAKVKKILCFRMADNSEDAERSTLKMDSNQKNKVSQKRVKMTYE